MMDSLSVIIESYLPEFTGSLNGNCGKCLLLWILEPLKVYNIKYINITCEHNYYCYTSKYKLGKIHEY